MAQVKRLPKTRLNKRSRPPQIGHVSASYSTKLVSSLEPALALVEQKVLPMTAPTGVRTDASSFKTLIETFGTFRFAFLERLRRNTELDARRAARGAEQKNKAEFERLLNVDVFPSEPWLRPMLEDWVSQNVSLVRGLGESSLAEMEQIILRMVRDGESISNIRKQLVERFEVSQNRARFIARDQMSKINGQLTEERQTRIGVTEYIWRTSQDQRVRSDHARLNGKVIQWDEPPITNRRTGDRNHPGGDFQCRCWADPVTDKLLT